MMFTSSLVAALLATARADTGKVTVTAYKVIGEAGINLWNPVDNPSPEKIPKPTMALPTGGIFGVMNLEQDSKPTMLETSFSPSRIYSKDLSSTCKPVEICKFYRVCKDKGLPCEGERIEKGTLLAGIIRECKDGVKKFLVLMSWSENGSLNNKWANKKIRRNYLLSKEDCTECLSPEKFISATTNQDVIPHVSNDYLKQPEWIRAGICRMTDSETKTQRSPRSYYFMQDPSTRDVFVHWTPESYYSIGKHDQKLRAKFAEDFEMMIVQIEEKVRSRREQEKKVLNQQESTLGISSTRRIGFGKVDSVVPNTNGTLTLTYTKVDLERFSREIVERKCGEPRSEEPRTGEPSGYLGKFLKNIPNPFQSTKIFSSVSTKPQPVEATKPQTVPAACPAADIKSNAKTLKLENLRATCHLPARDLEHFGLMSRSNLRRRLIDEAC